MVCSPAAVARAATAGIPLSPIDHVFAGAAACPLEFVFAHDGTIDAGAPVAFDVLVPAERCAVVLPAADRLDVRVCRPAPAPP